MSLLGKKILLFGSCGVLGVSHAKKLVAEGANLMIADKSGSMVESVARSLGCRFVFMNAEDEESIVSGIAYAVEELGGIDGAIYNVAITTEGLMKMEGIGFTKFAEASLEAWELALKVNLTGAFLFARQLDPVFKANETGGSLILVSSIYGAISPDHRIYEDQSFNTFPAYSASKAGLLGLMKWLATLWASHEIRVNCVSPGGIWNDHPESFSDLYGRRVPMGRMGKKDEISGILVYLLSDSSSYCTGQNILIDGGLSAW